MKRAVLILLALVMILSLAACGGGKDGGKDAPVEITVANNIIPNSLDPLTEDAAHNYSITHHI